MKHGNGLGGASGKADTTRHTERALHLGFLFGAFAFRHGYLLFDIEEGGLGGGVFDRGGYLLSGELVDLFGEVCGEKGSLSGEVYAEKAPLSAEISAEGGHFSGEISAE